MSLRDTQIARLLQEIRKLERKLDDIVYKHGITDEQKLAVMQDINDEISFKRQAVAAFIKL